jgi:hypothetical protein
MCMPKYGLATLIEEQPVGYEFMPDNTPLHLTQIDSFIIDLDPNAMASKLQEQLRDFPPFDIRAIKDELYGPEKDIPVTVFELNEPMKKFHQLIMKLIEVEGGVLKNPHYHNDGFSPHVSIYGSRRLPLNEPVTIKSISIAQKLSEEENAAHRILATVSLK